jgi:cytochrome c oxidase subunit 2
MIGRFSLFPEQASTIATQVDGLYYLLVGISAFFSILIALAIVVFVVRFRRGQPRQALPSGEGLLALEITWTVIPFLIAMGIFTWGARVFITFHTPPDDALQVYVVGKQWMWKIQHAEGRREIDELHVPIGRPVKLIMTSEDVIHSFFVPAFRVKQDAVPGRYTSLWFQATKAGEFHLFCAEYCGSQHARMIGRVVVMEPAEYQAWLTGSTGGPTAGASMETAGQQLFEQLGCATCHQGTAGARGPSLTGLFNTQVKLADGNTVVADEAYIRDSILNPQAAVVAGYQPIMPTFKGLVSEEGLLQLIAYIKSLKPTQIPSEAVPPGKTHAMLDDAAGRG